MTRAAKTALIGLAAALTISACASEPSTRWTKAGASKAEARAEYVDCRRQANTLMTQRGDYRYYEGDATGGAGQDPMTLAERQKLSNRLDALVEACMTEKGYYLPRG